MFTLRGYQVTDKQRIYKAWKSYLYVLYVLATAGGKTVLFADIVSEHPGASCLIAHRKELIIQSSLAYARNGVIHKIIGPHEIINLAVKLQVMEFGRSFYNPHSRTAIAGVDTLVRRAKSLKVWADQVTLWVTDEAHHLLRKNKWGRAVSMFPNAKGLGVTATPVRADGKGLGEIADGFFHTLIEGPDMRQLISDGYLTDYRIFAPSRVIDMSEVTLAASGDYNPKKLRQATRRSPIVGNIVEHYLRLTPGKLGVTFATDVETAGDIADEYNARGVPARMICGKTGHYERNTVLQQFRERKLQILVNVDLFGEGFDLPALEVVSMARPTLSYSLYAQQFGRSLRPLEGKSHATIIDHAGNVMVHGLPDAPRVWTLDRRERRRTTDVELNVHVKTCLSCMSVYERKFRACPYCGAVPPVRARTAPEFVDGDLEELDAATLEKLRQGKSLIDRSSDVYRTYLRQSGLHPVAVLADLKHHERNQAAQEELRDSIAQWAGVRLARGQERRVSWREFYLMFGTDVLSAQGLKATEAQKLNQRIAEAV